MTRGEGEKGANRTKPRFRWHPLTVTLVSVLAALLGCIAWVGFVDCVGRCGYPSSEAMHKLRRLHDASVSFHNRFDGLPDSAPMTPPRERHLDRCGFFRFQDERLRTPVEEWAGTSGWVMLNFAVTDPHRYSYQYDSSQVDGRWTFTASAFGDLDCDGQMSTFVRFGFEDEDGEIEGSPGAFIVDEDE